MTARLSVFVLITLCFALVGSAHAQQVPQKTTKYWITFTDKSDGTGKAPAPVERGYVSERALERRALRGRSDMGHVDAPISTTYKDELRVLGVEPLVESRWLNAVSAYLTEAQVKVVKQLRYVKSLQAVAGMETHEQVPSSPVLVENASHQIDFGDSRDQLDAINAVGVIERGINGTGVRIGFLDTTTDTNHVAFAHLREDNRIIAVRNFPAEVGLTQTNQHGLNTSSTALAFDEGELIGACHGAEYLFATTEFAPSETNQEEDFFVAGMEWMERMGADIVNVSLGYSEFQSGEDSYTYEDMDGDTPKTTRASDRAAALGVVVVASAGNEGCSSPQNCWYYITSPADGDSVIAVGATNFQGQRLSFSGRGPSFDGRIKPDVAAPGTSIRVASGPGYGFSGGTSFSSPLTASVACQILQTNPALNPIEVRDILRETANQADNPDNNLGWGVVNAEAAVQMAQGETTSVDPSPETLTSVQISAYPNPTRGAVTITLSSTETVAVYLHDILGRRVARAEKSGGVENNWTYRLDVRQLPAGVYWILPEGNFSASAEAIVVTD